MANGMALADDEQAAAIAAANSVLGRTQGMELFHSQTVDFNAPITVNVPRVLNLTRPLESFTVFLSFRATITVGPMTSVAPEAPQNILQQLQVQGIHRKFGALTPIRISGATAFAWPRLFQETGNDLLINGARAADPGRPFVSPFLGAVGTYDIIICYNVPTWPMMGIGQSVKRQAPFFYWHPQDWADSIQIQLNFGDESAFGDTTGATIAFTAFGSATGLPGLQIHTNYGLLGQLQNAISARSGVVIRNEQLLSQFVSTGSNIKLNTLQKNISPNVVLKTGSLETVAQSAGVTTFASLSDVQLDVTQLQVDNKPIRNNRNNLVQKDFYGRTMSTVIPQGYYPITFIDGQNALLSYRGDGLPAGSLFETVTDVLTTDSAQRQAIIQEMVFGGPFPSVRP